MPRPPVELAPDLITGDAEVDGAHRSLLAALHKLRAACDAGAGGAVLDEVLAFLGDHGFRHFADEEQKMAAIDYPYLATHIAAHRSFLNRLEELVATSHRVGDRQSCALTCLEFVSDWFARHVKLVDRPFIEYLRGERR